MRERARLSSSCTTCPSSAKMAFWQDVCRTSAGHLLDVDETSERSLDCSDWTLRGHDVLSGDKVVGRQGHAPSAGLPSLRPARGTSRCEPWSASKPLLWPLVGRRQTTPGRSWTPSCLGAEGRSQRGARPLRPALAVRASRTGGRLSATSAGAGYRPRGVSHGLDGHQDGCAGPRGREGDPRFSHARRSSVDLLDALQRPLETPESKAAPWCHKVCEASLRAPDAILAHSR